MKRVICSVVLAAFAGVMATALLAQDRPREGDRPRVEGNREGVREVAVPRVPEAAARMDKVVVFTDEQKAKIVELNKAREAAIKELNAKFQADVVALMTPEQKTKWEAASKEGERREGDRPREGARDGDRPREGPRDGDRPKEGVRDVPKIN